MKVLKKSGNWAVMVQGKMTAGDAVSGLLITEKLASNELLQMVSPKFNNKEFCDLVKEGNAISNIQQENIRRKLFFIH